jgi:hypothetical protein
VFVDVVPLEDGEHFFATQGCGPTSELEVRARRAASASRKNRKRNAAVYGMLLRTSDIGAGILGEDYVRPLPGVVVRLQSRGKSFEAKTDKHGAYAFEALPKGTTVFRRTRLSLWRWRSSAETRRCSNCLTALAMKARLLRCQPARSVDE